MNTVVIFLLGIAIGMQLNDVLHRMAEVKRLRKQTEKDE